MNLSVPWWAASAAAALALLFYGLRGRNAVWGGATAAILIGIMVAAFQPAFDWLIVWKAVVIGALVGLAAEWLPLLASRR